MKSIKNFTEKNIRALYERDQAELAKKSRIHKAAIWIANFSGTVTFALLNFSVFLFWILYNTFGHAFDPFPFILLNLTVSLEAIFLSTFVLICQNEISRQADRRHNLDLQINILAEKENTAMAKVLIEIAQKIGIEESKLKELKVMTSDTVPEEVLEKISEIENENTK